MVTMQEVYRIEAFLAFDVYQVTACSLLRSFSPAIEHFNADPASTLLMLP
jgi:hypothetical protein